MITVGQVLARLLWEQGRTYDRRSVIESGWRTASRPDWPQPAEALGLLRDHIAVDFESLAVDAFRILLDRARREAPEDDRVWLGWANLAIRNGQFADARRWIDACLRRRQDDPAVWQAELDWGLGTEQVDSVRRALNHLPGERFSRSRIEALRAWLAARRHDAETERHALEQLVQDEPGQCPAWERLAVLASQAGRVEQARELRGRKTAMDQATQRYIDLYNYNRFADDAPELARLAETLGRRFEAIGFLTWIGQHDPDNHAARTVLARLQGEETRRGARGQPPAQLLAGELAPEAGQMLAVPELYRYEGRRPSSAMTPKRSVSRSSTRTGSRVITSSRNSPEGASVSSTMTVTAGSMSTSCKGAGSRPIPLTPPGETACFATAATGRSKT